MLKTTPTDLTKPETIQELENSIRNVINNVTPEMLQRVLQAFYVRLGMCEIQDGRQFEHLL